MFLSTTGIYYMIIPIIYLFNILLGYINYYIVVYMTFCNILVCYSVGILRDIPSTIYLFRGNCILFCLYFVNSNYLFNKSSVILVIIY